MLRITFAWAVVALAVASPAEALQPSGTILEVRFSADLPIVKTAVPKSEWNSWVRAQANAALFSLDKELRAWEFKPPTDPPAQVPNLMLEVKSSGLADAPQIKISIVVNGLSTHPESVFEGSLYSASEYSAIIDKFYAREVLAQVAKRVTEVLFQEKWADVRRGLMKNARVADGLIPLPDGSALPIPFARVKDYYCRFRVEYLLNGAPGRGCCLGVGQFIAAQLGQSLLKVNHDAPLPGQAKIINIFALTLIPLSDLGVGGGQDIAPSPCREP